MRLAQQVAADLLPVSSDPPTSAKSVARRLDGEKMAGLCADFGISRKTGYKIYDRYRERA